VFSNCSKKSRYRVFVSEIGPDFSPELSQKQQQQQRPWLQNTLAEFDDTPYDDLLENLPVTPRKPVLQLTNKSIKRRELYKFPIDKR
jgi:hypothetical protein